MARAAEWRIQPAPTPSVSDGQLHGVSCSSSAACTAVGQYTNDSGALVMLAEHWDGTSWTVQSTPDPVGATGSSLSRVSCPSSTACTAVGQFFNGAVWVTLAEGWNGTSWTVQSTPVPAGATYSTLSGVSCTSSAACTATGHYFDSSGDKVMLAERWNGRSWERQSTPDPAGATNSALSDVSCTSSTACTSVGSYTNSAGIRVTLAERRNGAGWTVQSTPNPAGATASGLAGVSCPSSTACTGVGAYTNSAGVRVTLAERWNRTGWTVQSTPNPADAKESVLSGVSCTSGTACTAVGHYRTGPGVNVILAERWNGTGWTVQSTPIPADATSSVLFGVSCTSSADCAAVGQYVNNAGSGVTLAEGWNGMGWTLQSIPNPAGAPDSP